MRILIVIATLLFNISVFANENQSSHSICWALYEKSNIEWNQMQDSMKGILYTKTEIESINTEMNQVVYMQRYAALVEVMDEHCSWLYSQGYDHSAVAQEWQQELLSDIDKLITN